MAPWSSVGIILLRAQDSTRDAAVYLIIIIRFVMQGLGFWIAHPIMVRLKCRCGFETPSFRRVATRLD